jgi:probable HAF family extracellular repeat protein
MGPMNQTSGFGFDTVNYVGARFQLTSPVQVKTVGAHLAHDPQSGADSLVEYFIVGLSGPSGFPNFNVFPAYGYTFFCPPEISMDYRVSIDMPVLQPGWYAIVMRYDDDYPGMGIMPNTGQSSASPTSFITRTSTYWTNLFPLHPLRFVLEGNTIPQCGEPNTPINPVPWDGIKGVEPNISLRWSEQNSWPCATVYDVYLDKDNPPAALVGENLEARNFSPAVLDSNATYYWKVVAKTDSGQKASPVWTFTTEAQTARIVLPRYRIIDLGIISQIYWGDIPMGSSEATAVNEDGQVVGVSSSGAYQDSDAFYWHDANENGLSDEGEMVQLQDIYSTLTRGTDISDNGLAVGNYSPSRRNTGFRWLDSDHDKTIDGGEVQTLPVPAGFDDTYALGCNNKYQIAGGCAVLNQPSVACIWDVQMDTSTVLGALGGISSTARAINDVGIVVGSANIPDGNSHAFVWVDGNKDGTWSGSEMIDLGTLGGRSSYAYSVNNKGAVVGFSSDSNQQPRAYVWTDENANGLHDAGEMTRIDYSGGYSSRAASVNNHGQVVGEGYKYASNTASRYGFYWDKDNGMVELDKLVCNREDWIAITVGNHINDKGWITGGARKLDGQNHAVLLIPEYVAADLNCDKMVDLQDLALFALQWQLEPEKSDFYPGGGDGITNLREFAKIAYAYAYEAEYPLWPYELRADLYYDKKIDLKDIAEFTKKYLKLNSTNADIGPGTGDGQVDWNDLLLLTEYWLSVSTFN